MKTLTEFSTLMLRRAADAKQANAGAEGEALAEAVATTLGVPADRAARLLEALEIVGDNVAAVRLVRVFQGEKAPLGATTKGEFHYVVDKIVAPSGRKRDEGHGGEGRGGDRGRGGPKRDKPRGLGALKALAAGGAAPKSDDDDDRPARGEMPRAGIGWQLTAAPRDFRGGKDRGPKRGPGGPGGPRGDRKPRLGPDGQPLPPRGPRGPRLGADGQPLPPRGPRGPRPEGERAAAGNNGPRRERKPFGPDANGNGPDGQPWDPTRRAQREAERAAQHAQAPAAALEAAAPKPE